MYNIIKNYVNNLTINDIRSFALKNDIDLSNLELSIIYETLNNNLDNLLYNSESVFTNLKDKFSVDNYTKIYNLYNSYKKRYGNYFL